MRKDRVAGNGRWSRWWRAVPAGLALVLASPVDAQLGLPASTLPSTPLGDTLGRVGQDVLGGVDDLANTALEPGRTALRRLARERERRLSRFVERTPGVDWDADRNPARAGEVLLLDPNPQALARARAAGFKVLENTRLEGLGVAYARLAVPEGLSLRKALRSLRKVLPDHQISADQIHFRSGDGGVGVGEGSAATRNQALPRGGVVGVIDGGMAGSHRLFAQEGFAKGAPIPDDHASAIASLLVGAGTAKIYSADVYGTDPAGGDALSIARALAWMGQHNVPVVSISLVGPSNPLLARAIAGAQAKGMEVVAAVGNDGAAAPPAYPASYPGVVAVTGVDGRGRVLIEAGHASHLDYAAPGADMSALVPGKGRIDLRGTSFAAPLVASRLSARRGMGLTSAAALQALDGEAIGKASGTGRGIVCNICRSGL